MKTEFKNIVIGKKIQSLNAVVQYYERGYLPHLYDCTGRSQQEHLESALNDLETFKRDVNDYKQHNRFDLLDIPKYEVANFLRAYLIELYEQACDFKDNPYIKNGNLRKCIQLKNELIALYPHLDCYSNRAFRQRIKLN